MGFVEVFLIGVGLSMDAFAVSICKGLSMRQKDAGKSILIAVFFGFFQALMPLIGWLLGSSFEKYITAVDHWIVFALLFLLGAKMIVESLKKDADSCPAEPQKSGPAEIKQLFLLAIATSIDALAVGITFAFLKVKILPSCLIIGTTTLIISFMGVCLGSKFGSRFKSKAEFAGGILLIALGIKIIIEHIGI